MIQVRPLEIEGLLLIELSIHRDERGFFVERFRKDAFREAGLPYEFVQDNHSRSLPGVLRGLHFQTQPAQGKLIGVTRGRIWDVCVDLRKNSPSYGKHVGVELSDVNGLLLWVPAGFAHGFCVLGDTPADLLYKVDAPYSPKTEGGIHWSDPDLAIQWPLSNPMVSPRDQGLPKLLVTPPL